MKLACLVINEGKKWGNNDRHSFGHGCGQLVTEALSASRWHEDKTIHAQESCIHGLQLIGPEVMDTELAPEGVEYFGRKVQIPSHEVGVRSVVLCLTNESPFIVERFRY